MTDEDTVSQYLGYPCEFCGSTHSSRSCFHPGRAKYDVLTTELEAERLAHQRLRDENVALRQEIERLAPRLARQAVTVHEKTEAWREAWTENQRLRDGLATLEQEIASMRELGVREINREALLERLQSLLTQTHGDKA